VTPSLNRWLAALAVLLLAVAALGAAVVVRTHQSRADAALRQERYGAVLAAAEAEATAFVNLRYDRARRTVGAVAAGATGDFRRHYDTSSRHVVRVLRTHRSLMSGRVVWAGVVAVDPRHATVIVATTGTVSNTRTHGHPVTRSFRLRLSLVHVRDRWLTSNVQFVGDGR
jgi:Mce-associated membrane protein